MIYPFDKLYLSWRPAPGERRIIIGELSVEPSTGTPSFSYLDDGMKQVNKDLMGYPGLSYGQPINQEVALDLFYRRLINTERNDAYRLLNFFCVDMGRLDDKLYLLGMTTGQSAIDNFEFLPDLKPTAMPYDFVTEVAGLGYYGFDLNTIQEGDILPYKLEENNERDPYAVAIISNDGSTIGYIKQGINRIFHAEAKVTPYIHRIINDGNDPALFLRLHIEAK